MKRSTDGDDTSPPKPPPEIRPAQRPEFAHLLALVRHETRNPDARMWGFLPTHFRAGLTENFEREFCPHLDTWRFMESAQQEEPPCTFRLSDRNVRGCPTGQERECGIYVMHRCVGHSPQRARGANAVPFETDPKGDRFNPLRRRPKDPPEWVTETDNKETTP